MMNGGLASLITNQTATAAITNLAVQWTAPPGWLQVRQVYRLRLHFVYAHAAATTPTLTCELAIGGVALVAVVVTPVATAASFHGAFEGYFTVRTVGTTGTVMGSVHCASHGLTLASAGAAPAAVDTVADTVNTTIAQLVELRVRMTTAVASNTLTVTQGWVERVVA